MCTEIQLNNISEKIVKIYRQIYGYDIMYIYLYGSYARGNYNDESDIDYVAIVKGERHDLQSKLKKVWDLSVDINLEHDVIVSPSVIPYKEYEQYKRLLPYYKNIAKEGRRIG